jgi:hypothetical protein
MKRIMLVLSLYVVNISYASAASDESQLQSHVINSLLESAKSDIASSVDQGRDNHSLGQILELFSQKATRFLTQKEQTFKTHDKKARQKHLQASYRLYGIWYTARALADTWLSQTILWNVNRHRTSWHVPITDAKPYTPEIRTSSWTPVSSYQETFFEFVASFLDDRYEYHNGIYVMDHGTYEENGWYFYRQYEFFVLENMLLNFDTILNKTYQEAMLMEDIDVPVEEIASWKDSGMSSKWFIFHPYLQHYLSVPLEEEDLSPLDEEVSSFSYEESSWYKQILKDGQRGILDSDWLPISFSWITPREKPILNEGNPDYSKKEEEKNSDKKKEKEEEDKPEDTRTDREKAEESTLDAYDQEALRKLRAKLSFSAPEITQIRECIMNRCIGPTWLNARSMVFILNLYIISQGMLLPVTKQNS